MPTIRFTITRAFSSRVEPTENVKSCAAAFGIGVDETHELTLYRDLPIEIAPGRIIYLTGESGAGKSCCLRDIRSHLLGGLDGLDGGIEGGLEGAAGASVIEMPEIHDMPDRPLVDQFEDKPLKDVLEMLTYVGISEAFIFLRKPRELSDGQRYRFLLAKMIHAAFYKRDLGNIPVVLVDEFAAFLDRNTAKNVAYQTRRVATKFGIAFVLATTHTDIAEDLQADTTITFALNREPASKAVIPFIT